MIGSIPLKMYGYKTRAVINRARLITACVQYLCSFTTINTICFINPPSHRSNHCAYDCLNETHTGFGLAQQCWNICHVFNGPNLIFTDLGNNNNGDICSSQPRTYVEVERYSKGVARAGGPDCFPNCRQLLNNKTIGGKLLLTAR